jgi:SET domain-containing protein
MRLGGHPVPCYTNRSIMTKKSRQKPQKTHSEWAKVRGSRIHGRGMFASKVIPKGTRIIEYTGERITKAEGWRRELARQERAKRGADGCIYIFELNTKTDIDGSVLWNTARYINHSCAPNCESQIVRGRVWVVSLREILPGQELTYDYYYDYDHYQDHPCRCGAQDCAGYIVKAPVRWRVRQAAAAARKRSKATRGAA